MVHHEHSHVVLSGQREEGFYGLVVLPVDIPSGTLWADLLQSVDYHQPSVGVRDQPRLHRLKTTLAELGPPVGKDEAAGRLLPGQDLPQAPLQPAWVVLQG